MVSNEFPITYFKGVLVKLLDIVDYKDTNYTPEERIFNLSFAYTAAAKHFAQPYIRDTLDVPPKKLEAALRTITGMVVYSWTQVSPELMAELTIHYTYMLVLDDVGDDPTLAMDSWYQDLLQGKAQQHRWWKLVNANLPNVLSYYGGYCQMNIVRSTIDCTSI